MANLEILFQRRIGELVTRALASKYMPVHSYHRPE